jgi:hypothetical protein
MVLGHPSRSALSTPPIATSRISAQPTTRHRLRGERGWRGTTTSRTTTRTANERSPRSRMLVMQSSAPAPGSQSTWNSALGYRGQHLTVPISTNDLTLLHARPSYPNLGFRVVLPSVVISTLSPHTPVLLGSNLGIKSYVLHYSRTLHLSNSRLFSPVCTHSPSPQPQGTCRVPATRPWHVPIPPVIPGGEYSLTPGTIPR